ncbi:hypothetical protein Dsin_018189 [Dipteronia sinensis]|uniref:C3H1-type domain-containing protein n=1 Tax=Dipteronia sinensis TaxID=43782 RepID=A0AAE0A6E8_9ROSI|nr:hypothetical protein Dsin_018189 [Dipteronia sinensis]
MALRIPNSRNGHNPYNQHPTKNMICAFWLKGRCTRNPCRFLHPDASIQPPTQVPLQQFDGHVKTQPQIRVCDHWVSGSCAYGEKCRFLHTWFHSDEDKQSLSMLTRLEGHKKAVTGVRLPSWSDKLYSGAKDGTVRVWDCNTGKCVKIINNGAEIGCLIIEGQWVFIGLPNTVKAWRLDVAATGDYEEFVLDGPVGQVNSIAVCNGLLFAGSQDGVISVWRGSSDVNGFQLVASLEAHAGPVQSLSVQLERKRLFSSSNRWYNQGLDKTIKVWAANQGGKFELAYTHEEECGIVAVFGMADAQGKPILFSSCKDFTVRIYDLPSFKERARLFSRKDVGAIQSGPGGLFFLGEGTGTVCVWNWMAEQQNMPE